ncbi:Two-component response regulator SSK1p [Neonectria punicea]|uniref:Two-component response regulator SSK1p n=1 Tax=Neonectria punicea TaxID=979145 RepID=A0ABR1GXL4_9HYPO
MGATDIASRLRAKFSKRRHSATASSLASSVQSVADTSSVGSRHRWDWHRGRDQSYSEAHDDREHDDADIRDDRHHSTSRRAVSQTRATPGSSSFDCSPLDPNLTKDVPSDGPRQHRRQLGVDDAADATTRCNKEKTSTRARPESTEPEPTPVSSTSTQAVPPAAHVPTAADTAADTAPDDPNNPLKSPGPWQSRGRLAPNDHLGNDLQTSWHAPPQPQTQPNSSTSPTLSPDPSPSSSPTRPRARPSNSNLDRIHEDSSNDTSSSPAPQSDADVDVDAQPDARDHDDPLSPGFAPFIAIPPPSANPKPAPTATTPAVNFASSPGLPPARTLSSSSSSPSARPPGPPRRQSLLSNRQSALIKTLLHSPLPTDSGVDPSLLLPIDANMVTRKIWVKRPHASPTLVTINEDDLVDDVRDMILRKYANSLGRTFDSPDLNIRICPRDQPKDRLLGPEEPMGRTLDAYFPGGQTVDEALVIDIPRRAPKASPHPVTHASHIYSNDEVRPSETGEGYFPPVNAGASPHPPAAVPVHGNSQVPHSIAILGTGQLPLIPSPGGGRSSRTYRERPERPRLGRTHTSSPTILANGAAASTTAHEVTGMPPPVAPPLPTPPAPEPSQAQVSTPPARISSPRPSASRVKKAKKNSEHPSLPPGMLNGGVPPINVLIVEDNPINLKLLEAFVKRLKVRWQSAMNGRDAVKKWRTGGFHLVLMDIQLPIMNGLEATREIRRLERVNSIGVFSSTPSSGLPEEEITDELKEQDRLDNLALFMSPVIIVALTASSLQSDRHEALAAGCNDFLTKPVNFVWLERKVMEWGCMQALIDFDGWRKWKIISQEAEENEAAKKAAAAAAKVKSKKNKQSLS